MIICKACTFSYFERNFTKRHPDSDVGDIIIIIVIIIVKDSVIVAQL